MELKQLQADVHVIPDPLRKEKNQYESEERDSLSLATSKMPCKLINLCEYETHKLVRIQSARLGSLKWTFNGVILMFIW
jgi:hypothetical protein